MKSETVYWVFAKNNRFIRADNEEWKIVEDCFFYDKIFCEHYREHFDLTDCYTNVKTKKKWESRLKKL